MQAQVCQEATARTRLGNVDRRSRLAVLTAEVTRLKTERRQEVSAHDRGVAASTGMLALLEALHRLETHHPILAGKHLAQTVLLTAIECLPVIWKTILMLSKPTTYEKLVALDDEKMVDLAKLDIVADRWEKERRAQLRLETIAARTRTEMKTEIAAANIIFTAEMALVKLRVDAWQVQQSAAFEAMKHGVGVLPDVVIAQSIPTGRSPLSPRWCQEARSFGAGRNGMPCLGRVVSVHGCTP